MDATTSVYDSLSRRYASQWFWVARFLWLLMVLASLVIFAQGVRIFIEELRWTYGANYGLSLQRSRTNELMLIPIEGGQAARAGVMERDVLVAVDGELASVDDAGALDGLLTEGMAGTAVTLQIRTGDRPPREISLIRGDRAGAWLNRFNIPVAAVVTVAVGVELLVTLGFIAVAAFIFWRRGQTTIVWLSSLVLVLVFAGAGSLPVQSLYFAELDWQYGLDIWFSLMVVALLLFLFLFPSGRFVPGWAVVLLPLSLVWVVAAWLWPDLYFWRLDSWPYLLVLIIFLLTGVAAQLWRYRFVSSAQQRQQTKWVVWGTCVALTALFVQFAAGQLLPYSPLPFDLLINPLTRLVQLIIPVAFALAIFQRRLWEIDVIVNRTLVYGGLTALITVVYIFLVGVMGTLAANQSGLILGLVLATAIVMVGIRPMLSRWQVAVSRFVSVPEVPGSPSEKVTSAANGSHSLGLEDGSSAGGARPWFRLLAATLFFLALAITAIYIVLSLTACRTFLPSDVTGWIERLVGPLGGMAFATVGLVILYRQPANRIGWLCSLAGLGLTLGGVSADYVDCALAGQISPPGLALTAWFSYVVLPLLTIAPIFIFLPLWFPNGHFLTRRWRTFGIVMLTLMAILTLALAITPDLRTDNGFGVSYLLDNPVGLAWLPEWWGSVLPNAFNLLTIFGSLAAIMSMILRYRQSVGEERQQMKLFAYWTIVAVVQLVVFELISYRLGPILESIGWYQPLLLAYSLILIAVFLGFPLVIGIAIFRYRLYDIDIIINRTLVYGGLSLGIVAVYILVVGALGALFQAQGSFLFALLATGLIAVLFQPVREHLQRGVNRLMFGERDDPYAALSRLGAQLQTTDTPEGTLQSVVETIATSLKLPYVAIELADSQGRLEGAATGEAVAETVELPLRYQNELVGYLVVSPRSPGESFTGREQRLLADMAAQTGAMAYSMRLTVALQRSREKLVLTREEERRRIRRDLHDGLGPTLASQTFVLDAILDLLETNSQEAARLVRGLKSQNQETVAEIRRLVYELRPPALDELGLYGALEAHVAQLNSSQDLQIRITTQPDPLPPLSAAVEVAAYRIALEGVTNVVRHAGARLCDVCLEITGSDRRQLHVDISDDGRGLSPGYHPGVGLNSMQERAEELGGSCRIAAGKSGGTHVMAVLPISVSVRSRA
jgi:signal transduction histidine kinase